MTNDDDLDDDDDGGEGGCGGGGDDGDDSGIDSTWSTTQDNPHYSLALMKSTTC